MSFTNGDLAVDNPHLHREHDPVDTGQVPVHHDDSPVQLHRHLQQSRPRPGGLLAPARPQQPGVCLDIQVR